ncbi:Pyridoxamine 5'-phosphate oxidase [Frankia torreyi]|uniref:Pyridoxamine 5'-phosphate oxidase n=1 Tax=Frankia torreyi TaxID=1856 RepID=A0A0D8B6N6_9ACTN|nr:MULTISPECIES: pyridoxamine 5'-phosphate oxidase family protein [Frankia]KJE19831.1 Pyridoxamine 5'-phosphate oxidase [Frankia torreyi]KQM02111.1 Pyridoxamine 5'-phosphate oxidase [Frankia sp. CpI1-P]
MILSPQAVAFLAEDYSGIFSTLRPDGSPHAAPVRFTPCFALRILLRRPAPVILFSGHGG